MVKKQSPAQPLLQSTCLPRWHRTRKIGNHSPDGWYCPGRTQWILLIPTMRRLHLILPPTPPPLLPPIDYKKLAIEVAMRIAPKGGALEHTIENSLGRFQEDLEVHSSRLNKLEQRVSRLEDENTSLQKQYARSTQRKSARTTKWKTTKTIHVVIIKDYSDFQKRSKWRNYTAYAKWKCQKL